MARVASDGPFSEFPGIDRTLAVVKGSGLVLTIGDSRAGDAFKRQPTRSAFPATRRHRRG